MYELFGQSGENLAQIASVLRPLGRLRFTPSRQLSKCHELGSQIRMVLRNDVADEGGKTGLGLIDFFARKTGWDCGVHEEVRHKRMNWSLTHSVYDDILWMSRSRYP